MASTVRQIYPDAIAPVDDPAARYWADARPPHADRPWVLVNMVTSVDGATARDGVSRALSSDVDRAVFHTLRAISDVILVGAGTVRAERYGPPRAYPERAATGRPPAPRLAIVSGRLDLDPELRCFAAADVAPIIATCATADPIRRERLAGCAELVLAGDDRVDLAVALRHLRATGAEVVVCEGGGHLNGQLLAAGLIDEVCLTMSAQLAGGTSPRAIAAAPENGRRLRLDRALEDGSDLLLRYVVV